MTFGDAVRSVLTQYTGFSGRARRSEYWYFLLFSFLVSTVASMVDAALHSAVLGLLVTLGLILPSLAVGVRRLHDIDRTGWWLLIGLIPLVGAIVLIVFACTDSQPGPNRFGPPVKGDVAPHEWSQQPPTVPPTWR